MKALFIGGTGTISMAISQLAVKGLDLYLLNRGSKDAPEGVTVIKSDINDTDSVLEKSGEWILMLWQILLLTSLPMLRGI